MSYTLGFLAILMSAVVWWLVKQTINISPWAAQTSTNAVRDEGVRSPFTAAPLISVKLGLGVFLAVVTSLFALFISAYSIRMEYSDWRPLTEPSLLWINSAVLIFSSIALQWAYNNARRANLTNARVGVTAAALGTLGFIFGQGIAWQQLSGAGYFIQGNPANAFFYLLTGLHAVHLIGGLIALNRTLIKVWKGQDSVAICTGIELCAVYWHYLLAVWLVLFGMLLMT
ncbi:MAG: cytochrome c oxidase subunit 3 [Pseudomonadales bacterium]